VPARFAQSRIDACRASCSSVAAIGTGPSSLQRLTE
jgi:hypothetical protein